MSHPILLGMDTWAEPIKMAAACRAMRAAGTDVQVLPDGQQDSMAWSLHDFFEMPTPHAMAVERGGGTLAHPHAVLLTKSQNELEPHKPRAALVHSEPSSAAMLAPAAFYHQIPLGHVEAGLRGDDNDIPFPEAMNRQLTS